MNKHPMMYKEQMLQWMDVQEVSEQNKDREKPGK